ncbi:MAG: efflux RND transporter periplasmic adaptor subunit [Bacteroidota bacterium]|nr:efflux RND transporter periplasmic adaptor subunit [Bacteroidota bacterium]
MKTAYIALLFIASLISCNSATKKEADKKTAAPATPSNVVTLTAAQKQTAGIQTDSLRDKMLSTIIKVNGSVDVPPQNMVSVSVPLGGYLKSTQLLPGMHVNKGEPIAVIEDLQYIQLQQDYLTTKSQLAFDEADYQRQKELNASKASSDKSFQQAQMKYNSSRAGIKALAQKLRMININPNHLSPENISKTIRIYSPIKGFVSKVDQNIGKYLNPADVLFELVDPSDLHLNLHVFEKDVDKISVGQQLFAYTNNDTTKKYDCRIILISKDISAERTAEVHCHFETYDNTLLPGMYMNAGIEIKGVNSVSLPDEAIVNFEAKDYVFVALDSNKYKMTMVKTGIEQNGFTQIENKELSNQPIVTKGAYTLLMKLKNTADTEGN